MKHLSMLSRVCLASLLTGLSLNAYAFDFLNDLESTLNNVAKEVGGAIESTTKAASDAVNNANKRQPGSSGSSASNLGKGGRTLKATALNNIFLDHVFDSKLDKSKQYPRVALTVHSEPRFHNTQFPLLHTERQERGCWSVSAVLWHSSKKSEKVAPFEWCTPKDVAYEVPLGDITYWSLGYASLYGYDETGTKRTNGPNPPDKAFPDDVRHKKHFSETNLSPFTYNGVLIASLIYQMGFDWANKPDKRIWVTKFDSAYK